MILQYNFSLKIKLNQLFINKSVILQTAFIGKPYFQR